MEEAFQSDGLFPMKVPRTPYRESASKPNLTKGVGVIESDKNLPGSPHREELLPPGAVGLQEYHNGLPQFERRFFSLVGGSLIAAALRRSKIGGPMPPVRVFFVLLLVISAATTNRPAFARSRVDFCLPGEKRVCTLGPPPVCHCESQSVPPAKADSPNGTGGGNKKRSR
jgi:hypothetical protein